MSVWTTRSSGKHKEYVLLKHTLKGVNYIVNGVRFRESYAVVEKNSKTYNNLKQLPVLKSAQEYPLIMLRQLKFITRPLDVKTVYGADVYKHYLEQLEPQVEKEKVEEIVKVETAHVEEHKMCSYRTIASGGKDLCKEKALEQSPSGYCMKHIFEEPRLAEFGIEVPKFLTRKEKYPAKEKVAVQLAKAKKEGKF
jgi:hypothetical protein